MMKNILKSLLKPDAYPEPTNKVELIQTHVSWIFLTDSHAYKVKKPIDFGFLNFSTIDRRRFYCNEEIKYNRRLCPDIYEGVVELNQTSDGAAFQCNGPVLDYAVKMKRLPAKRMLDILVLNNEVTHSDLSSVAKTVADFHMSLITSPAVSAFGNLDKIKFNWKENLDQTDGIDEKILSPEDRATIRKWVASFIDLNADFFKQRVDLGYIRECDGDLHLENICLTDNKVYIFDCIEFNERFRNCDTAADIAFLLMDLDYHGRRDLSEHVLTTYLQITNDNGMLKVLTFYKVYRAFIRGKVESLRLNDKDQDQREFDRISVKASMYFRLARGYIESQDLANTLFITCGFMGTGKSSLSTQLSFELGLNNYNSDKVRKEHAVISPEQYLASSFRQGLYSQEKNDETYSELLRLAENDLKFNRSVIIDACFMQKNYRQLFADLALRYAVRFVILNVSCNEQENRRRLNERSTSGKSISDGREELLSYQQKLYEPPSSEEGLLIQINANKPPFMLTNTIYKQLH